jgi:hypothetical protein
MSKITYEDAIPKIIGMGSVNIVYDTDFLNGRWDLINKGRKDFEEKLRRKIFKFNQTNFNPDKEMAIAKGNII